MPTGKHQAPPQTEGPWVSCEESGLLPSQVVNSFLLPQLSGAWLWDLRSEREREEGSPHLQPGFCGLPGKVQQWEPQIGSAVSGHKCVTPRESQNLERQWVVSQE